MNNIKITKTSSYLPKEIITNEYLEKKLNLEKGYIEKRSGIQERRYVKNETIEEIAIEVTKNMKLTQEEKDQIGIVIVATTTTNNLMPGIANHIQKTLNIEPCICLDILAGCSGFINAMDIAKLYIESGKVEKALIIGVDILSKYTNEKDVNTAILLSDGAGAVLLEKSNEEKEYMSYIVADGRNNEMLTCKSNQKIEMDGKEVYKYAVTVPTQNVKKLLDKSNEDISNIK